MCLVLNTPNLKQLSHEEAPKFVSDHLYCSDKITKDNNHAKCYVISVAHFNCK
jgi:lysozyme family protein